MLSSVRCFKSSTDTIPLNVWTGQGITTPCLTVTGYREVSDRNIAHPLDLMGFFSTKIRDITYSTLKHTGHEAEIVKTMHVNMYVHWDRLYSNTVCVAWTQDQC